jgi:hypothetical protein
LRAFCAAVARGDREDSTPGRVRRQPPRLVPTPPLALASTPLAWPTARRSRPRSTTPLAFGEPPPPAVEEGAEKKKPVTEEQEGEEKPDAVEPKDDF